ncbi:unnamed protein product [Durusdinium trenchii]|uniref:ATP-dependent DNA helicase n=1 Tax=Durusdinium trenchii TaxID=1381693 RepID=A0ABP0QNI4_9DINO
MPMWQAMKGAAWTPQYWQVRHAAALDMQAQCGYPIAFITWAPFEWSAPYHEALLQQMRDLGRQRLGLAGPESLHLAHLLTELFREWVCGGGRKFGDATSQWKAALFGGTKPDGSRVKVNFVGRLEFQDGKRKESTQDYHGRGAVHLHGLVFAESIKHMKLHEKFQATVPAEGDPLRGLVLDGQTSRTGSGWPVFEGLSHYDAAVDKVKLHHSKEDKRLGVRGYSPEVLDVLKCHQDAQIERGTGLMLKYAATYLPKFSDGPGKELMDDSSSGYGAARRALFTFHPGEPEMWMLLANQSFPMFVMGGTMQPIIAPHPGMEQPPAYVALYEQATWRGEMTLLEYLRRVNNKGNILEHIRKAHKKDTRGLSLESFAIRYETFGEKVIAAEMVSMLNDKYYGQWMALNVPFETLSGLLVQDIVDKVPEHVKFLACALHWAPHVWRNEQAIREHMALRARKESLVNTVVQMIKTQEFFIQLHLNGHLEREMRVRPAARLMPSYFEDADGGFRLTAEQKRVAENIDQRVDQALAIRDAADEQEMERLLGLADEHGSIVAVSGQPGTGKTAVVDLCVKRAQRLHARILLAMPTGVQRSRMKQRHPEVDLDTCHGAFLFHKPLIEAMGIMMCYDLIVIDEAVQLFEEHFERLHQMWLAAGKVPCLVFVGDEWQLPPPDNTKRSLVHHPKWRFVYKVELHKVWRQADGDPLLEKLAYLRKNRPMGGEGSAFVRDMCRGHKAWSGHHEPTNLDIQDLLRKTDGVLFELPGCIKLGGVGADYESNPDNYHWNGTAYEMKQDQSPEPLKLDLYEGLRIRLTRNMNKRLDYVNGMTAIVQAFDRSSGGVIVETETKQVLCVYPLTEDAGGGRVVYYPMKPGYADTVHKFQGAELAHVTFWPDREGCAAAAYVALSRVRKDADYLLGGYIKPEHFVPAK